MEGKIQSTFLKIDRERGRGRAKKNKSLSVSTVPSQRSYITVDFTARTFYDEHIVSRLVNVLVMWTWVSPVLCSRQRERQQALSLMLTCSTVTVLRCSAWTPTKLQGAAGFGDEWVFIWAAEWHSVRSCLEALVFHFTAHFTIPPCPQPHTEYITRVVLALVVFGEMNTHCKNVGW